MTRMIFVNLPVTDVARSRRFHEALGFTINEQFSDAGAACVVVSETIYLMVLSRPVFQGFSALPVADPAQVTAALIALTCDSREAVDAMASAALAAGGSEPRPAQDHGFMYNRAFADPDGNVFEAVWMDPAAVSG